ncbi:Holliday junction resolvase RecU [Anaerosolibacter sp.]|uniref:Holliday junction resolvase RecU n=1 Tax=Anaerosolibacter sp. TaxID=1872527 RepID=UPI0039F06487
MYTQRDKQKRGSDFEGEFRASLNHSGCWGLKIITGFAGTPFDYIAMSTHGNAIAVELKRVAENKLNYSQIRANQRKGLTDFLNKGGISAIVCNVKNDKENRCYWIPWQHIMNEVNSGQKGSVKVDQFQELKRIKLNSGKYGWDLSEVLQEVVH